MKDLQKINLLQLYLFWKNLTIALSLLIVMLVVSTWLPPVFSLFAAIICAAVIYVKIYLNKTSHHPTYVIVGYALMLSIIVYTMIILTTSLLDVWGVMDFNPAFTLFDRPFISVLILAPVCVGMLILTYVRRQAIHRYLDHAFGVNSDMFLKGKLGAILSRESRTQMLNLIKLFSAMTLVNWTYYVWFYYKDAMVNAKDIYIFFWINVGALTAYIIYLIFHNYSLDAELKESGELVTPQEASAMSPKNYFRFYVICDNRLYVRYDCDDPDYQAHKVVDTPYFFMHVGRMVSDSEVNAMISKASGVSDGTLRFFFGFRMPGLESHVVLRYFYFLDGKPEDYPQLGTDGGEWMTFDQIKDMHLRKPHALSSYLVADAHRAVTIMRAEKLYDAHGRRKHVLKTYTPSVNLSSLQHSQIDFQSNQWIEVAMLNSDKPFFRLRKMLRRLTHGATGINAKLW